MLYNYNYDVAAFIMGAFLLTVYLIRRTMRTRSNKILFVLLVCNILGSAFDFVSSFTISYPQDYPLWVNYFVTYGYLFFYNAMGILFLAYVDSKTKIVSLYKPLGMYKWIITAFEFILIFTSPYTHLVSYFDENMVYKHGPLMTLLYTLAGLHLACSAVLFVRRRKRFNRYQVMAMVSFIVVVFLGVLIQILVPSLLVGQFGCALVLFFIYTSLENPAYYTYRGTTCYNRRAFLEIMKIRIRNKETSNAIVLAINDYDNYKEQLSASNIGRLSSYIAEYLSSMYRVNAFCLADDRYLVIVRDEKEAAQVKQSIDTLLETPIDLVSQIVKVKVSSKVICNLEECGNSDLIESGIHDVIEHNFEDGKAVDFTATVDKIKRRRDISKILKQAIEDDLFDMYYQPIKCAENGKFQSAEALIRLKSQEYGFISPEEFIPIAENDGLIVKIGEMVFEKVCRFIRESKVTTQFGVKYIEINLSPIQCIQPDIVSRFRDIMDKYDIVPFWLNLEITETASIEQSEQLLSNINRFHNMGIEFSLDDYGSGFASADYLFRLPVELVKIDKSILWQGMKDVNAGIVLLGTLRLLKNLGKKIVVEGVEDQDMEALLLDNGCDFLQGYYYSKPVTEYEYVEFLKAHNE